MSLLPRSGAGKRTSSCMVKWMLHLRGYIKDCPSRCRPYMFFKDFDVVLVLINQQYLLGYLHGRPDAQLVEMRRILNEAFDQDVSLPTLSRTLKLRGCMKGHRKQRDFRPAPTLTPTKPKDNVIMVTPSSSVPDGVLAPSGVHPINPADHSGSTGEASHPETNAILQRITTDTTTEAYQSPYPDLSNTEQSSLVFEQLQDYMNLVEQTPQEPVTPLDPTICS